MKNPPHLDVTALGCCVSEHALFESLSFRLFAGEGLVVTGPNGSGKTTLLRTLAGLRIADHGTVALEGFGAEIRMQQAMHFIGHRDGLRGVMTVRENLVFAGQLLGQAQPAEKAASALAVAHLLDLPVGVLSAGQRRRVALARLLASNRKLWLLDEPTAALDIASHGLVEDLITAHLASGGMVIAATHLPLKGASLRSLAFNADGTFQLGEGL